MTDVVVTVVGLVLGGAFSVLVWHLGRAWLSLPGAGGDDAGPARPLLRENYAGRMVPVTGGIPVAAGALSAVACLVVVDAATEGIDAVALARFVLPVTVLLLGFALLGFFDDVLGGDDAKGFTGHLRSLAGGRLTTGLVKLVGGGAVALVVVAPRGGGFWWLLSDAAIVALAANLANLLDRAPGRLLKASLVAAVPLFWVGWRGPEVAAAAPVLGASWGMLPPDLREETMLGDTGANVVGAVLGWSTVELAGGPARAAVLVCLVLANVASELVSFSKLIAAVPPLRWLDGVGRRLA